MATIKNVKLFYAKVNEPTLEYKKKAVQDKPWMNKEFVVDVLIDPKTFKAFKRKYKNVKAVKDAKALTEDEFKTTYQVDEVPENFVDSDGDLNVVKFRKKAYYNDGKEAFAPKVVGIKGKKYDQDGLEVIGKAIGNGTDGHIQFRERTWDNEHGKGLALDLTALCITKLLEFETDSLEFDFEEIDEDEFGDSDNFVEDDEQEEESSKGSDSDNDEEEEDESGW